MFSLQTHHGGEFSKFPRREYMKGSVTSPILGSNNVTARISYQLYPKFSFSLNNLQQFWSALAFKNTNSYHKDRTDLKYRIESDVTIVYLQNKSS